MTLSCKGEDRIIICGRVGGISKGIVRIAHQFS